MSRRIFFVSVGVAAALGVVWACSAGSPSVTAPKNIPRSNYLRVADCDGPPVSLQANLRTLLGPRTGQTDPDDHWADLAEQIPGGFAGVLYSDGKPVLMLTHPEQATEAKLALASDPTFNGFDLAHAEVRKARWDFAQLVDWYQYLGGQTSVWSTPGMTAGDKNEVTNRIYFGVETEAGRQELKRQLLAANVPCDLIQIGLQSPVTF
jgi:hypothetical protein